jgi:hypothetical protein
MAEALELSKALSKGRRPRPAGAAVVFRKFLPVPIRPRYAWKETPRSRARPRSWRDVLADWSEASEPSPANPFVGLVYYRTSTDTVGRLSSSWTT